MNGDRVVLSALEIVVKDGVLPESPSWSGSNSALWTLMIRYLSVALRLFPVFTKWSSNTSRIKLMFAVDVHW